MKYRLANLLVLALCSEPITAQPRSLPYISPEVSGSLLIERKAPIYPPLAQSGGVSGVVRLDAVISPQGEVEELNAVCGSPFLLQAAIDAVKTWRYGPYLVSGRPARFKTTVSVAFPTDQLLPLAPCPALPAELQRTPDERRNQDSVQKPLTNNTIIRMAKAGLSDEIIVATIQSHPGEYKTEPDDLIALKAAHVSNEVILAMTANPANPESEQQLQSGEAKAPVLSTPDRAIDGVIQAEIGNGEMKLARFAKILVVPSKASSDLVDKIETLRSTVENARTNADGDSARRIVEIQCLESLVQLRVALIHMGVSSSAPILFDADGSGEFHINGISFDHYRIVAIGKVGMNAALWVSPEKSLAERECITMDQPAIGCYDAEAIF